VSVRREIQELAVDFGHPVRRIGEVPPTTGSKESQMSNYVLAYTGGSMAETEEEQAAAMAAWGAWIGGLGDSLVDAGNPFGASASVASDGATTEGGASGLTGYSIISADSLDAATVATKGCPVFTSGGAIEVYEIFPVM
jgi:hypothetical protein